MIESSSYHIEVDKTLILVSRIVSWVFTPFLIPTVSFLMLFIFSSLRIMPMSYKIFVLGLVFSFTVIMPALTIYLFRKIQGLTLNELSERKWRFMPYLLTIISYIFCLLLMQRMNIPWYMTGIILAALLLMIVFILANLKWKFSEHAGGGGAVLGGIVSFSALFGYNPLGLLCLIIPVAGILGSARIILGHHKLGEVMFGFIIGFLCAVVVLHPSYNEACRFLLF
jgi:hypothetical protein